MKRSDFIALIEPYANGSDYVLYALRVSDTRWWTTIVILLCNPSTFKQWFLIACGEDGILVQVDIWKGVVLETLAVPGWKPEWKEHFRKVTIGDRTFHKYVRDRARRS